MGKGGGRTGVRRRGITSHQLVAKSFPDWGKREITIVRQAELQLYTQSHHNRYFIFLILQSKKEKNSIIKSVLRILQERRQHIPTAGRDHLADLFAVKAFYRTSLSALVGPFLSFSYTKHNTESCWKVFFFSTCCVSIKTTVENNKLLVNFWSHISFQW